MELIEADPPSIRPRGTPTRRPPSAVCGVLRQHQSRLLPIKNTNPKGVLTKGWRSLGPASSTRMSRPGFRSNKRPAQVLPPDPPPMTIMSAAEITASLDHRMACDYERSWSNKSERLVICPTARSKIGAGLQNLCSRAPYPQMRANTCPAPSWSIEKSGPPRQVG